MFGIFKRVTRLEKEVLAVSLESGDTLGMVYDLEKKIEHLESQVDMLVVAVTRTRLGMNETAAPKKKLKVTTYKKSDPIPFQPQWVENAVSYDKEGRMVYAPKKKRGRPRKIK